MSMNISGLGNSYNGVNTNSKQYKALEENGWLSGVIQNEAMMSPEEKMIYEIFGGRDTIIKNLMKQFDSNGDTTKRSDVFRDYQLSVSKDKRLSGTWTLEQYEGQYRAAMYAAVKSANPNWKPGQIFDTSILDNVTREAVEATLVQNGNRIVRNSIDVSV